MLDTFSFFASRYTETALKARKTERAAPESALYNPEKNWLSRQELESSIAEFLLDCEYRGQLKRT